MSPLNNLRAPGTTVSTGFRRFLAAPATVPGESSVFRRWPRPTGGT